MSAVERLAKQNFSNSSRRHDLDWLRVIGMAVLILVHCARYFDKYGWHVENQTSVPLLTYFVNFAGQWLMPMFMLLAGMAARYALQSRDWKTYLQERRRRLLVPFIFGVLVLSPPQIYLERLTHAQFEGSLWAFLPTYFEGWYGFGGNFAWMGLHLWFLLLLFVFAILTLTFFWRFRDKGHWPFSAGAALVVVLFVLAGTEIIVNQFPAGLGRRNFGGWSPVTYLILYLSGYGLAANPEIEGWIRRIWVAGLVVGILGSALGFLRFGLWYEHYGVGSSIVRALAAWGWLIGILGFASSWLDRRHGALTKLSSAVLPIYILHQPIIVLVGYWILNWRMGVFTKYLLLGSISFVVIMLSYEFIVRRIGFIHALFGMK